MPANIDLSSLEKAFLSQERDFVGKVREESEKQHKVAQEMRLKNKGHILWSSGKDENQLAWRIRINSRSRSPLIPSYRRNTLVVTDAKSTSPNSNKGELSSVILTRLQRSTQLLASLKSNLAKNDLCLSISMRSRFFEASQSNTCFSARSASSEFKFHGSNFVSTTKISPPSLRKPVIKKPMPRVISPMPELKGFTCYHDISKMSSSD